MRLLRKSVSTLKRHYKNQDHKVETASSINPLHLAVQARL